MTCFSNKQIYELARLWYKDAPLLTRTLQTYRPYVCPFFNILELIPDQVDSLLDVGCGNGLFLSLASHFHPLKNAVGVDVDQNSVNQANKIKNKVKSFSSDCKVDYVLVSEVSKYSDFKFDVITMIDVLHHVPKKEWESFIKHYLSFLKPGGLLLVKEMNNKPFLMMMANQIHDLLLARQWINHISKEKLNDIGHKSGLKSTDFIEIKKLWYSHYAFSFSKSI